MISGGYPNVEETLVTLLQRFVAGPRHIGTDTPGDLQDRLAFIRVSKLGGPDDGLTESSDVDVSVYAPTYRAGWDLAETIRQFLTTRPHRVTVADKVAVLDRIECGVSPFEPPTRSGATSTGASVREFTATYTVNARRVRA